MPGGGCTEKYWIEQNGACRKNRAVCSHRALSKGHAARAAGVGGGLKETLARAPDRVDRPEEHRVFFVGEDLLVSREIRFFSPGLVGEEVPLSVQSWSVDCIIQMRAEIYNVYERLGDGGGDTGGAGRAQGEEVAVGRGDDRRAHAGDQALPGG